MCSSDLWNGAVTWSFSKDISGCPVESGLAGVSLEAGRFHCGQVRPGGGWTSEVTEGMERRRGA